MKHSWKDKKKSGIIEAVFQQHIAFEGIHPFSGGNDRVGRALMVYTCLQNNIVPIVVTKENKAEYINYLNTEDVMEFTWFVVELNEAEQIRLEMFS